MKWTLAPTGSRTSDLLCVCWSSVSRCYILYLLGSDYVTFTLERNHTPTFFFSFFFLSVFFPFSWTIIRGRIFLKQYLFAFSAVWLARAPPGFAFVRFEHPRDAEDAVRDLNGRRILGQAVRVEVSKGRSRNNDRSRSNRDEKCYECGGFGHYARDCNRRGSGSGSGSRGRSRSRSPRRRSHSRERQDRNRRSRSPKKESSRKRSSSPRKASPAKRSASPANGRRSKSPARGKSPERAAASAGSDSRDAEVANNADDS